MQYILSACPLSFCLCLDDDSLLYSQTIDPHAETITITHCDSLTLTTHDFPLSALNLLLLLVSRLHINYPLRLPNSVHAVSVQPRRMICVDTYTLLTTLAALIPLVQRHLLDSISSNDLRWPQLSFILWCLILLTLKSWSSPDLAGRYSLYFRRTLPTMVRPRRALLPFLIPMASLPTSV